MNWTTQNYNNSRIPRGFLAKILLLLALSFLTLSLISCTKAVFESVDNGKYTLTPQEPIFVTPSKTASTEGQRIELRVKNQLYRHGFNIVDSADKAKYLLHVELRENRATVTETSGSGSGVAFSIPLGDSFSLGVPITSSRETSETSQTVRSRTLYIKVYSAASNELAWAGSATYGIDQPAPYYNSIINNLLNSYGESYYGRIKITK